MALFFYGGNRMGKSPIIEYETQEQAEISLKEWQTRLFLDDWIIQLNLEHQEVEGIDTVGYCNSAPIVRSAVIWLTPKGKYPDDAIIKYCAEKTLVHELLHCVYIAFESSDRQIANVYYEEEQHALIEKMARSLIMAKYDISLDWFKNY